MKKRLWKKMLKACQLKLAKTTVEIIVEPEVITGQVVLAGQPAELETDVLAEQLEKSVEIRQERRLPRPIIGKPIFCVSTDYLIRRAMEQEKEGIHWESVF